MARPTTSQAALLPSSTGEHVAHGKYHPYPRRFGGGRYGGKPLLQVVHESLNAQRGAAFDTESETSIASIESLAWARAIVFDGWEVNARLGHQWDAWRTTDMLPRWERIFKIRPAPGASERARRAVLAGRWSAFGASANHARIVTALERELGDFFVDVEYIDINNAVIHVPDTSYPWGSVVAGVPWYSTVAHLLVRLQKPTGATEAQFYEAAGKVVTTLDPVVSAFATFDWYRAPESGTPIEVSGGPSAAGFYLDNEHNLDNSVFDTPPAPAILSIEPSSIPEAGGTPVTIAGKYLATTTVVRFSLSASPGDPGTDVPFAATDNQITCTSASGIAGFSGYVHVTTPGGSASKQFIFV